MCCKALATRTVTLENGKDDYPIGKQIEILEDKTAKLTINDIIFGNHDNEFKKSESENPSYPLSDNNYWVRFVLKNNAPQEDWLLVLEYSYMSDFDLYSYSYTTDGTHVVGVMDSIKAGFKYPFTDRFFGFQYLMHRLPKTSYENQVIYLKMNSITPMGIHLKILSAREFISHYTTSEYITGFYYGMVLVLFIYSIFNFIALRRRTYVWYALYILSIALLLFAIDGRTHRYFFPHHQFWALHFLNFIMMASIFFGMMYGRNFLDTHRLLPRFDKILRIFVLIGGTGMVWVFFTPIRFNMQLSQYLPVPVVLSLTVAAILCMKKGHKPAGLFLSGFIFFAIGSVITSLAFSSVVEYSVYSVHAMHVGSALEAIFLMFGLSQQMRLLKREQEEAQQQVIEQMKENETLQTKVTRELEEKVRERTSEIEQQKVLIEAKNKDITDSILYAKRIQQAILPDDIFLREVLDDHFVLYKPKDIVSGDFYWAEKKNGASLFAAVDCTGHGVPGAFVSMLGYNGLNQAVTEKNLTKPAEILHELEKYISAALKQTTHLEKVKDGMDLSLCTFHRRERTLEFAGAMNPVYIIRNGGLQTIKGDRMSIGGEQEADKKEFTNHSISLQAGDCVYVFTDGFVDQFGGHKRKKFMTRQFKDLLEKISTRSMKEQRDILESTIDKWRGELEQIDDILVIGMRV